MNESEETPFGFSEDERLEYERTLLRLMFSTLIESYLEETGLQAQELATRMRKSKSWVSKLLSGSHNPTLDTLADVALALGLRWDVNLCSVDRGGTPAVADPQPPHWVASKPGSRSGQVVHLRLPSLLGLEAHWGSTVTFLTNDSVADPAAPWITPQSLRCVSAGAIGAREETMNILRAGNSR